MASVSNHQVVKAGAITVPGFNPDADQIQAVVGLTTTVSAALDSAGNIWVLDLKRRAVLAQGTTPAGYASRFTPGSVALGDGRAVIATGQHAFVLSYRDGQLNTGPVVAYGQPSSLPVLGVFSGPSGLAVLYATFASTTDRAVVLRLQGLRIDDTTLGLRSTPFKARTTYGWFAMAWDSLSTCSDVGYALLRDTDAQRLVGIEVDIAGCTFTSAYVSTPGSVTSGSSMLGLREGSGELVSLLELDRMPGYAHLSVGTNAGVTSWPIGKNRYFDIGTILGGITSAQTWLDLGTAIDPWKSAYQLEVIFHTGAPAGTPTYTPLTISDLAAVKSMLVTTIEEFAKYPPSLVVDSDLGAIHYVRDGLDGTGLGFKVNPAAMAIGSDFWTECPETYDRTDWGRIINHEFFHVMDFTWHGYSSQADAWSAANPPGFTYGTDVDAWVHSLGFVDGYARHNIVEDRAEHWGWMMMSSLYDQMRGYQDPYITKKMRLLNAFVKAHNGQMGGYFFSALHGELPGVFSESSNTHVIGQQPAIAMAYDYAADGAVTVIQAGDEDLLVAEVPVEGPVVDSLLGQPLQRASSTGIYSVVYAWLSPTMLVLEHAGYPSPYCAEDAVVPVTPKITSGAMGAARVVFRST